ncbi:PecA family PE domain-processing aspartic protease [Mycobacterium sp.]|uniref:PecA family PE domain-processing aspartic protease n=1 Tax=Mycobacterium sp. TaxID=1785 RepID=UPI0025EC275C|nr:PecA family PE domain-processing aspartic protease [Mycobacterium sp.]MBW0015705.1 PecA family PE domain-processing aspartic protease [Mycobacterium sp.]
MSFLVYPPEINSSLIHSGAGSGPMLAAAASWDGLATELSSAAQSFSSVTSGLAGEAWQGAASAAMMQTASQYAGFLTAAASQAQTAAAQAQTVAGVFESAVAATVHPALVSANRNQLVRLVVSNLFGQNAPAIAAAEADYEAMWAQDVAAMVGYHGGVSAAAAQLSTWTAALPNLAAQMPAAISSQAGSPLSSASSLVNSVTSATGNPLGGLLGSNSSLSGNFGHLAGAPQRLAVDLINLPGSLLFGQDLIPTGPQAVGGLGGSISGGNATAPLRIVGGTEPIVNASVGTGSAVPLLVDTGSTGLVIPFTDIGGIVGLLQLGAPHGFGIGGYSGGLNYLYARYDAPVNFGGGLVTGSTPINVELLAWPSSVQSLLNNGPTFQSFFATDGAAGVLGVGPNAGGPGHSIPLQALPSPYNQGLLINEATSSPYLQFGPNPFAPVTSLNGSPVTGLQVQVGNGPPQTVNSIIDSGGVSGTVPSSVLGNAPTGTLVTVSANGVPLYSYTVGSPNAPTTISSGLMNTGAAPYLVRPIYISFSPNGVGTTVFD